MHRTTNSSVFELKALTQDALGELLKVGARQLLAQAVETQLAELWAQRAGCEWDAGVHYLGDMGAKTIVRRLTDFLTQGHLDWAPMDAHHRIRAASTPGKSGRSLSTSTVRSAQ